MKGRPRNTIDDFWKYVPKTKGCWEWQGARTGHNYGAARWHDRNWGAHRLMWYVVNGPIPKDMSVLHKCDNPPCVNPEHLFLGTNADNMRDRDLKSRGFLVRGEGNWKAKLMPEDVKGIRWLYDNGVDPFVISVMYKASKSTVYAVHTRQNWGWL